MSKENKPDNLREVQKEDNRKFLYLTIFTLVVVGGGLIALIYGSESLFTSLPCLLAGVGLILIPWWVITALEKWRDSLDD